MKIAVIDGQGGGLGKNIIDKIRKELGNAVEILALGTNPFAATAMIKAGADDGITGEGAICSCIRRDKIDCIVGPIGIVCPNSMLGELTSDIAETVFKADCTKYLIPINKHGLFIPGVQHMQVNDFIQEIILELKKRLIE